MQSVFGLALWVAVVSIVVAVIIAITRFKRVRHLAEPVIVPALIFVPFFSLLYPIARLRGRKRTTYILSEGWLHVETGGFFGVKEYQSFELLHLIEAKVTSGPLDQLTGNGVLHLKFEREIKTELRGLGPIEEIQHLPYQLMNLARLMRTSSMVRSGIIA